MSALIACQCRRGTPACKRLATQEDFMCDVCRGGCSQIGFGPVGTAPEQLEMTSHWEPPTVTWGEPVIIDDPPPPAGADSTVFGKAMQEWFGTSGIRPITSLRRPEIDSAASGTPGRADTPPDPPSDRTSPHARNTGPTSNPRNEGQ